MGFPQTTKPADATRKWRSVLRFLIFATTAVLAVVVLLLVALQAPPVGTRLTNMVLGRVATVPGARLEVREVRGNWLTRLELRDFRMVRADSVLAAADTVRLGLRPWALLAGTVDVSSLEITGPELSSTFVTASSGGLAPTHPRSDANRARPLYTGPELQVGRLEIRRGRYENATADASSTFRVDVGLMARDLRLGDTVAVIVDSLSLKVTTSKPDAIPVRLAVAGSIAAGRVEISRLNVDGLGSTLRGKGTAPFGTGDSIQAIEIDLHADPIDLGDLSLLIPTLDWHGDVSANVVLRGTRLDALSGSARIDCSEIRLGDVHFGASRLAADFADGRAELDAAITWEEARTILSGWIRPLDRAPSYDLELMLDRLPHRLPGVPWWPAFSQRAAVSTQLQVRGRGYGDAALHVESDFIADTGRISLGGDLRLRPELEWDVQRLALENLDLAHWTGVTTPSNVTGTLTAHGRGTTAESLHLLATWNLAASRHGQWEILSSEGRANLERREVDGALQLATTAGLVTIDSLTARFGEDGRFSIPAVRFSSLDLAGVTGNQAAHSDLHGVLRCDGTIDRKGGRASNAAPWQRLGATARLVLEPSRLRNREIQRAEATLRLRDGRLDVALSMNTDGGDVELGAEFRPFDAAPEIVVSEFRFLDADVRAWTNVPAPTRLNGALSGRAKAWADEAGPTDRTSTGGLGRSLASWSAELHLEPSVVGSLAITGGEVAAGSSDGRFEGRARLQTEAGEARLETEATPGERGPHGRARLAVPFGILTAFAGRDSLPTSGGLRVESDFDGIDPESGRLEARVDGRGRMGSWQVDSLFTVVHLAEGGLSVDTLTLRSNAATVGGSGRLALADSTRTSPSDLRLQVQTVDPPRLRTLLRADTLALAEGRLEAHITGFRPDLSVTVRASLDSLAWNRFTIGRAEAEAQGVLDHQWHLTASSATARVVRLRHSMLRMNEAVARAEFDGGRLQTHLTANLDGAHTVTLTGTAERDSAGLRVGLSDAVIEAPERLWRLREPTRLSCRDGRCTLDSLEVRSDDSYILARGILDRHGQQNFSVEVNQLNLAVVAASLGREDLGGTLDGQVSIAGPGTASRIDGTIRVQATSEGAAAGVLVGRLRMAESRADIHVSLTSPAMDSVTVVASLPVDRAASASAQRPADGSGDGELRATAHRFPLADLVPFMSAGTVSNVQGVLDVDVHLTHEGKQVRGNGQVNIADGTIGLPTLGVVYRDIQFAGVLDGDRITLHEGRVRSEGGDIQLAGDLRVSSLSRVEPDLTATFRDFVAVSSPDLRIRASGELHVTGSSSAPELAGQVVADDCTYYITDATVGGTRAGSDVVLSPADLRMLEETFGSRYRPGPSPFKGVYEASSLDLRVSLEHDNWIRRRRAPRLSLEVTGDVHVRKPAHGELDLRGRLAPVPGRGTIEQFGRTFDFVGGEVLLNGPMRDHTVDIRTEYKVRTPGTSEEPDVIVHLDVVSEADKLRLVLSSEPPLSETEIISYITTGRSPTKPQSDTGSGSDAAALAADIGMSQVTGALEDVVQEKVGLDVLQVRYDALQGATLMAGRYVNSSLYIGLRQPLQYRETGLNSSQHPYQTAVDLEYAAYRWLLFDLQGEASLVRGFIRARHSY